MAVALKPIQQLNKELDQKKNILRAAGMLPADQDVSADGRSIEELFAEFTVRAVDLQTGEYVDDVDVVTYDPIRAAKDSSTSVALSPEEDIATLRRRENVSLVYLKATATGIDKVVMPVRGYGLWGTLYGYLALDGDLNTIAGLGFYQHKETPGLGGEVDNSKWKASWQGVRLFNDMGQPQVKLVKQRSASTNACGQLRSGCTVRCHVHDQGSGEHGELLDG
jgi:Na+-transporting NADH:ubiquinone oxidoreductase subunit C